MTSLTPSMATEDGKQIPVRLFIESRRMNARQWSIALLILLALVLDGLDLIMLAFVAPIMTAEWHVERSAFGYALSAALATMALGAYLGGRAGDRFGRKRVLVMSVLGFAATTIATSHVGGIQELIVLRLLGGLGFGAATPNGIALATAWLPQRRFILISSAISVASPIGGILAGYITLWLVPSLGWRGCFMLSGYAALLVGLAILIWVPEGPDHDLARGRLDRIQRTLLRVFGAVPVDLARMAPDIRKCTARPRLFTRERLKFHIGIGIGFFFCSYVTFAFSNWATTLLTARGLSFADAARAYLGYNILAVASALVMPVLLSGMGSRAVMALAAACSLAMLVLIAAANDLVGGPSSVALVPLLWTAVAGVGLGQGLLNATFYAVISHAYPTEMRAGGSGFALMVNRAGGFVAIIASGYAMTAAGPFVFLAQLGGALLAALVGVAIVDRHIRVDRRPALDDGSRYVLSAGEDGAGA